MTNNDKSYEILETPINFMSGTPECHENCRDMVHYYDSYLREIKSDTCLALIILGIYSNSEDYLDKGFSKTSRKSLKKTRDSDFSFRKMTLDERNERLKELFEINTSAKERQGGEMSEEYTNFPEKIQDLGSCPWHSNTLYEAFAPDGSGWGIFFLRDAERSVHHTGYLAIPHISGMG